jgi:hypothetical protein
VRLRERLAEEPLRRSRIAPCSQQESIVCPRLSTAR